MDVEIRGFHTQKKTMFSAAEMAADQLTLLPTGQFINVSGESTRLSVIYPADKFIPLFYTGSKDKNNKKIFEGDIIATWDEEGTRFLDSVGWDEDGLCWGVKSKGEYMITLSEISDHEIEVIGNIYENPELLEAKV